MAVKPKLNRDWKGRYVRLLYEVSNKGGTTFPAGSVMKVLRYFGDLRLEYATVCKKCELRHCHYIRLRESDVELLPENFKP